MCVVLLISFILLQRRLKKMTKEEQDLKETLSEQHSLVESKSHELDKVLKDMADTKKELKKTASELESFGSEDSLTKLSNRKFFDKSLKREWQRAYRHKRPLALLWYSVDFYEEFVQAYGRDEAENCLVRVAQILQETVKRPGDISARVDDHQFASILPETATDGAMTVAEKIRKRVEALAIPHKYGPIDPFVTVSGGLISVIPTTYHGAGILVEKARDALDRAKQDGRNCVKL
jgi:two-component system, cell cycle response regulator